MEMIVGLLGGLVLCGGFVFIMVCAVLTEKNQKEAKARAVLEAEDTSAQEQTFDATVVDLQCRVVTLGQRSVKTVNEYLVFLQRADGTVCRYPVSEEFYQCFEIGQRGCVTLVDGVIYGFSLQGEDKIESL